MVTSCNSLPFVQRPTELKSENQTRSRETVFAARRFAHASQPRADRALQALLGMSRFRSDDTILNYFRRFTQGEIEHFWRPLMALAPERSCGLCQADSPKTRKTDESGRNLSLAGCGLVIHFVRLTQGIALPPRFTGCTESGVLDRVSFGKIARRTFDPANSSSEVSP